jgi:hypothetical protein
VKRPAAAALLLALVANSGGCSFDLTEVQQSPREARLWVQLDVLERSAPLDVAAGFHPGTTMGGKLRSLADDSLRVDGVGVAPAEVRADGSRLYRVAGLSASAPPLLFRPPVVADLPDAPPEFAAESIRIVVPDTLIVARPATIEIRLLGLAHAAGGRTDGYWSLHVFADTGRAAILSLNGHTPPPPVLRMPSELLPEQLVRARVELQGTMLQSFASVTGSYHVQVVRRFGGSIPLRIRN